MKKPLLLEAAFQFVKPGRSAHKLDHEGDPLKGSGIQRYGFPGFHSPFGVPALVVFTGWSDGFRIGFYFLIGLFRILDFFGLDFRFLRN